MEGRQRGMGFAQPWLKTQQIELILDCPLPYPVAHTSMLLSIPMLLSLSSEMAGKGLGMIYSLFVWVRPDWG